MRYSRRKSPELRPKLGKTEARLIAEAKAIDWLVANGWEIPWISQKLLDDTVRQMAQPK
jgi:hypothetical protein